MRNKVLAMSAAAIIVALWAVRSNGQTAQPYTPTLVTQCIASTTACGDPQGTNIARPGRPTCLGLSPGPCAGKTCFTCNGQFDQPHRICVSANAAGPSTQRCAMLETGLLPCGSEFTGTCQRDLFSQLCLCSPMGSPVGDCTFQECEGTVN